MNKCIMGFLILLSYNIQAQNFCNFKIDTQSTIQLRGVLGKENTSRGYDGIKPMIRIALHRVTKTDGTGGFTWNEIRNWVAILPNAFANFNICFTVVAETNINSDNFHNSPFNNNSDLIITNRVSNAINIYFAEKFYGGQSTGYLSGTTNHSVTIGRTVSANYYDQLNTFILAHEIGHCLGLLHTHQTDLCIEEIPRTGPTANCTTCGDELCDTEADPGLEISPISVNENSCIYIEHQTRNGFNYTPLTRNIMSYSLPKCLLSFTSGQGNRMRNYVLYNPFLDNYVIPFNKDIFGNLSSNLYFSVENNLNSPAFGTPDITDVSQGYVIFEAGSAVILNPGFNTSFSSSLGGSFTAQIGNYSCVNPLTKNSAKTDETSESDNSQIFIEDNFDDISLFPNPVIDKVFIEINATNMTLCDMSILDVSGRQVYSEKYNLKKGKNAYQFDLKSLSSGFYFAKFNIGGLISMKKFQVESRQ